MVSTYVTAYAAAWALTALTCYLIGRVLMDAANPPDHRILISVLAGVVWPVLVLGLVESGVLAVIAGGGEKSDSAPEDSVGGADVVTLP